MFKETSVVLVYPATNWSPDNGGGGVKTVLIAGGSGGHLIPALALAEHLAPFGPCLILSTSRPVDQTLSIVSSMEWVTVDLQQVRPLTRWLSPSYTGRQFGAMRQIVSVLRHVQPDVVVGFGGYLSAVGVTAARLTGFPTVVHEQNFVLGRSNRWVSHLVDAVAVTFPETRKHLSPRLRVEVTGNPIRIQGRAVHAEEARRSFGFDLDRPVLLLMGGSQGAQAINHLGTAMWEECLEEDRRRIQVLHLAGSQEALQVETAYRELGVDARVFPFVHDMERVYQASTLGISRAGATTIAELIASAVPTILIPYPHAGGHQRANARWLEALGGAFLLEEEGLTPRFLGIAVRSLLSDPIHLSAMRTALRAQADGSAVERLGSLVRKVVG